jgi:predicted NAD/FAD-binding protein
LFEADSRPGGHSNTVSIDSLDGKETVGVDTGFIVCNPITYPNFLNFLEALGVPLLQSDMSFSVSRNQGEFEWAGGSLDAVFAQRKNLFPFGKNGGVWRMLMEILRFHKQAKDIATEADRMVFTDSGAVKNAKALGKICFDKL